MSKFAITVIQTVEGASYGVNTAIFDQSEIEDICQVVKDDGGCLTEKLLPLLEKVGAVPERSFDIYVRLDIQATSLEEAERLADDAVCGLEHDAYVDDIVDSE